MTSHGKIMFIPFKGFLWLLAGVFAIAAALLIILSTSAATIEGGTPTSAMPLAEGVNEGTLRPVEQHWYTFTPGDTKGQSIEKSLLLTFTPDDGNIIRFVRLKIFEEDQIQFFSEGDTSQMTSFGTGQVVSLDGNPETGELYWKGSVSASKTYYIQVLNESDFTIDYQLTSTDISSQPVDETEVPVEDVTAPAAPAPAAVVPQMGSNPGSPAPLLAGTNRGTLKPHSTYWYSFRHVDLTGRKKFKELDFSLLFTPDDGNRRHHVNFELFPFSEFEIWRRGDVDKLTNFGAGMLVSRGNDPNVGQRIWRGSVLMGDTYLMAVENGTDVEIDYWIFDQDIFDVELGPKPAPAPAPVFAPGAAPQTALPLKIGVNKGGLEPGEEAWYSFSITDFDGESFEEMALTMITTPDDGNRIRNMTFDVFTAGGVTYWSPGDNSQINNMGAGSVVYRDDSPLTGERFWHGWLIDNDLYYVQIRNGTKVHMDYWLFTGDVYRPPLGEEPKRVARPPAAPGTAPTAPLDLEVGVNQGRLGPKQERWYVFSRGDVNKTGSVETVFTMVFTPDDGNRVRDVNIELFEGNQLRDWAPDNRFNIINFGQGSVVNRDGDPNTGEFIWHGHVIAGDRYYMRVSNETDVTIDYWIFPEEVINANLTP